MSASFMTSFAALLQRYELRETVLDQGRKKASYPNVIYFSFYADRLLSIKGPMQDDDEPVVCHV